MVLSSLNELRCEEHALDFQKNSKCPRVILYMGGVFMCVSMRIWILMCACIQNTEYELRAHKYGDCNQMWFIVVTNIELIDWKTFSELNRANEWACVDWACEHE